MKKTSFREPKLLDIKYVGAVIAGGLISTLISLLVGSVHAQVIPGVGGGPPLGLRNVEVVWSTVPAENVNTVAACPSGKIAIGGGGVVTGGNEIDESRPDGSSIAPGGSVDGSTTIGATGWKVGEMGGGTGPGYISAYAVCATP